MSIDNSAKIRLRKSFVTRVLVDRTLLYFLFLYVNEYYSKFMVIISYRCIIRVEVQLMVPFKDQYVPLSVPLCLSNLLFPNYNFSVIWSAYIKLTYI